jgi:hypothetical protein
MMRTELAVQTSEHMMREEGRTLLKRPQSQWLVDTPLWFVDSSVDMTDWLWLDRLGPDRRRKTIGDTGWGRKNLRRNMAWVGYIPKILLGRMGSLAVKPESTVVDQRGLMVRNSQSTEAVFHNSEGF